MDSFKSFEHLEVEVWIRKYLAVGSHRLLSEQVIRAYDQIKRTGLADNGEIASYASLGGTGRNSLSEPINMTSQSMQAKLLVDVQVAVRPLDSEIINRFLARSCAKQATTVIV